MESNKDEALRCLAIAQRHRDSGNIPSARKFCEKSINLFSTTEALQLLATINAAAASASASSTGTGKSGSSTSAAEHHPSASGTKQRRAANGVGTAGGIGGDKREYTPEQREVVKRVRACKITEYYEILAVKKDCDDGEIKKAYRKLALALHPDKNGAPGADEAFKLVSKAFQVLSDPQKRAAFDRYGSDPESRFNGMRTGSPVNPFGEGNSFAGEMSAEDLFNMFFNDGSGMSFGGPFGGPVFTATFGPGGFRTSRTNPMQPRQNGGEANPQRSILLQLLPLILLFAFSLLSSLPSLFSSTPIPDPYFSFTPSTRYNTERLTGGLGIRYHVNKQEFMSHPQIAADVAAASIAGVAQGKRGSALHRFENTVERVYTQDLYVQCQRGEERKQRRKDAEVGFFGIGTDWEKVREIGAEVVSSCEELQKLGVLR